MQIKNDFAEQMNAMKHMFDACKQKNFEMKKWNCRMEMVCVRHCVNPNMERERLHDMDTQLYMCRAYDKPNSTKSFFPEFNFFVVLVAVEMTLWNGIKQFVTEMTKR